MYTKSSSTSYTSFPPKQKPSSMATKAELVFIPSPGLGHMASAVEIARLILNREKMLCISVFFMKLPMDFGIQPYIELLSSTPRLTFVDITLDEKSAAEFLSDKENFFLRFIQGHKLKVKDFVHNMFSRGSRLVGFILDMFCTSMIDVANEFSLPSYIFYTSSASFLALCFHFESLKKDHHVDISKYRNSDEKLEILGFSKPYPAKFLPTLATEETPLTTWFFDCVTRFKDTKGIIVNTFAELEPFALESLSNSKKLPPIYAVGPVVNFKEGHGRNSPSETEEIIKWLDDQPESSVIFLCFGSIGSFDVEQVKEIAIALECSGHRFLWSLRRPPPKGKIELPSNYDNFEEVLPEGFIERTKGVGKVIGWAPQTAVLSHPAVGGFVSHCGWNSTLESLCCGVPIATWPLYAEQQMNAFLLVKELGLGVEIRIDYFRSFEGKDGDSVDTISAKDIESGIRQLMEGNEIRKKVKEMKEQSCEAVKEGGSSYTSLGLLLEDFMISNIS